MNANLSYMLSRVTSVSTQTFKLDPQNSTSCAASGQIRVALPSNTLLNLKSIKMIANVTTDGSGARASPYAPRALADTGAGWKRGTSIAT